MATVSNCLLLPLLPLLLLLLLLLHGSTLLGIKGRLTSEVRANGAVNMENRQELTGRECATSPICILDVLQRDGKRESSRRESSQG